MASEEAADVSIVLFSKDRPFQLRECLWSIRACVLGAADVTVLYTASTDEIDGHYAAVEAAFLDEIAAIRAAGDQRGARLTFRFVRETDFAEDLVAILELVASPLLAFLVDDLLFLREFRVDALLHLVQRGFGACFLKLHPGVSFSHPAGRRCWPPRMEYVAASDGGSPAGTAAGFASWRVAEGRGDWGYLWDMCGTVYPTGWARGLALRTLRVIGERGLRPGPNTLEAHGNGVAREEPAHAFPGELAVCPLQRALAVLAVNRVQSAYRVPVYGADGGGELLETGLLGTHRLCTAAIAARSPACVHVGSPRLVPLLAPRPVRGVPAAAAVTVVLPARNAEGAVGDALRSVFGQRGCPPFRVLVLDDGSTDGTAAEIRDAVAAGGGVAEQVRVVRRACGPHTVAHAGEELLRRVDTPWFARIDADDVWDPSHLARAEAHARHRGTAAHVVGSSVLRTAMESPGVGTVLPLPCNPVHVLYSTLFFDPVAHSSALVRTETARSAGGYLPEVQHGTSEGPAATDPGDGDDDGLASARVCEDYSLWCRILARHPLGISNVPDVLTTLRKHSGNTTTKEAAGAGLVAGAIARGLVGSVLGKASETTQRPGFDGAIACLREPGAGSQQALEVAAMILVEWESEVLSIASQVEDAEEREDAQIGAEIVRQETDARLGELALSSLVREQDPVAALGSPLFRQWMARCPREAAARMQALLAAP